MSYDPPSPTATEQHPWNLYPLTSRRKSQKRPLMGARGGEAGDNRFSLDDLFLDQEGEVRESMAIESDDTTDALDVPFLWSKERVEHLKLTLVDSVGDEPNYQRLSSLQHALRFHVG